jgi:methylmalonyl-CoA/ethylmalonyl-CoA epimerase
LPSSAIIKLLDADVCVALAKCYLARSKVAKNRPEYVLELPLDHVAVAVPSISAATALFELISGCTSSPVERVEAQGVDVAFIGSIELLQPSSPDSTVQKFLEKRGAGLHHIAYRVSDIDATLARLEAAGIQLIDKKGRPGARGHRVAFLHPKSTNGVLIELVER